MVTDTPLRPANRPGPLTTRPSGLVLRLCLTAQAAGRMIVAPVAGALLFSLWVTTVALVPLTVTAPLLLPVTGLVRRYARRQRRSAGAVLGLDARRPYRRARGEGMRAQVIAVLRDSASWRDAFWLPVHAIVGCVCAAVSVALFLGGLFYLAYPLLFALTPRSVFGHPFGNLLMLHSTTQACVMMPLALLSFGLWWALQLPLVRAEARMDRSLLRV